MRPYTILHVCDSLSVGGAERLILGLAKHLDQQRFAMRVCSLGVLRGNLLQPEFEKLGVPVDSIGSQQFYNPAALAAVAKIVRTHGVDLIHTHLTYADVVGRVAGKLTGRPVVSTLHNEPFDYNRQRLDRRMLQRLTARYAATRLVAVSPSLRDAFVRAWGLPSDRVVAIMNAVPLDQFLDIPARPSTAADADVVITNIGRLNPQKAQALLLEAMQQVLQVHGRARLMIVGQGRLEQELKTQAQALGIAERVVFTGVRNNVAEVLAETDIFVLSSRWEGLPVTAAEAMAAGRAVVLTDVGGNRDLVDHGVNGLIVPPNDVAALRNALQELIANTTKREAMGRAARERARHALNMHTFAKRHEDLYQSLLLPSAQTDYRAPESP